MDEISQKSDMLHGNIARAMIVFALPLLASGLLQQSFNSIDIAVVGRWCSKQSLAAVGSNGMVISLLINLFVGISVGANVIIANRIGRGDTDAVRRAVRTAMAVAVISGFVLMGAGAIFARPLLRLMATPDDVIDLSTLYLTIFFLGMPFMMVYNFGAAVLRSRGDTRRPFYALLAGGVVNIALNLLFVVSFGMDVAGVAVATVIANAVNAALIVHYLRREDDPFTLRWRSLSIDRSSLVKEMRIGIPAGLQGMVFSISNVFVQSAVNRLGSDAVAGSAAAVNYEMYCYFLIVAVNQAVVAFTAQNYGAGNAARCRRVMTVGLTLGLITTAAANLTVASFPDFFVGIFSQNPEVIAYGRIRVEHVLAFQFIACTYEITGASMRGLGYSMTPTLITVFGSCVLRVVAVQIMFATGYDFGRLMYLYPLSWIVTGVLTLAAYRSVTRKAYSHLPVFTPDTKIPRPAETRLRNIE